jgi:hypothetical protein
MDLKKTEKSFLIFPWSLDAKIAAFQQDDEIA